MIYYGVPKNTQHKLMHSLLFYALYTTLHIEGPLKVRNLHESNIFKCKLILLPIHAVNHLMLCVVCLPIHDKQTKANTQLKIQYMNSTKIHNTNQIIKNMRN